MDTNINPEGSDLVEALRARALSTNETSYGINKPPKKRVLFVITQSELGGAQQFIIEFIKQIKKDPYDISVAVGSDGDGSFIRSLANIGIAAFTIPALKRNISPISDIQAIFQIKKVISAFEPDTLFLGSSKAGFIGTLAAKLINSKLKVIYRIGGWSFNDPIPNWQKKMWEILEKISAPWKDIIIVNNSHDLIQAKEMGIKPRQDLVLIYNGLDPYKIDFIDKNTARTELGLPSAIKIVGTIANFYPAKGLESIIEVATKINRDDVIFCVIGDGAGRTNLEKLIRENNLGEKVILLGRKESASRYLTAFDVFLLPSLKEGFPWAVLEAMAAKLPIIATRVGAVPEILEDGLNGYIVEPNNTDQIAERVTTLLDSDTKSQEMGIQAHQRLLFAFNIDTTIRQIEKLL